jgi:hypothetical protein
MRAMITRRRSGQVLVFFALVLPIVLLPVAAYAVDAAVTAASYARLVEATASAAEDAAQQIDVAALRMNGAVVLDVAAATKVAQDDIAAEQDTRLIAVTVDGGQITVSAAATVVLPLNFLGTPLVTLRSRATARIAPGYDSPSSRLPLPVSTF